MSAQHVGGEPVESATGRERVERAAYRLFSSQGVRAVGVDAVINEAGVAKMTLYRNFGSKDELILAFLRRRETEWTHGWLRAGSTARGNTARQRLLAIFDLFDEWFHRPDFEGCSFVTTMLEYTERDSPVRGASVAHLAEIRRYLRELAAEAGVADPVGFARQWHILMKGSIISAAEGDAEAARRARAIGELLLSAEGL